jgi:polar amino acid transport system substrate-binding protein
VGAPSASFARMGTWATRHRRVITAPLLSLLSAMAVAAVPTLTGLTAAGPAAAQESDEDAGTDQTLPAGTVLRVATKPLEPFVFLDGSEPRGFSIDYWTEVAARLGAETEWVEQETVSDIIDSARTGDVDAAIAGISITREREQVIDFSQPYYLSGHQIVIRQSGNGDVIRALASVVASRGFLIPLAGLVLLVIVVSHLVWYFERGHESDDFPVEYRRGVGEALWWSTVSVVTGGGVVKNINTALSRFIALMWMLIGLLLLAYITARATSILTVTELQNDVDGLEDLAGRSVSTVAGTESVTFLLEEGGIIAQEAPTLDEALQDLVAGRTDAVVFDAGVVAHAVNNSYQGKLTLVEPVVGRDPYGIALPPGSELLEEVNGAVIEIGRDGTLDELEKRWFGTS